MDIKLNTTIGGLSQGSLKVSLKNGHSSSLDSALERISSLKSDQVRDLNQDKVIRLADEKEARELSIEVASQLNSPFIEEEEKEIFIETSTGNLDPYKVSFLLED